MVRVCKGILFLVWSVLVVLSYKVLIDSLVGPGGFIAYMLSGIVFFVLVLIVPVVYMERNE